MAVNTMTLCGVLLLLLVHGSRLNTSSSVASLRGAQQNGLSRGEPAPGLVKVFHDIMARFAAHPDVEQFLKSPELSNPATAAGISLSENAQEKASRALREAMTSAWDSSFIPVGHLGHVLCIKGMDLLKQDPGGFLFCLNLNSVQSASPAQAAAEADAAVESITAQRHTRKYVGTGQLYGAHGLTKAFELEWSFQQGDNVSDTITDLYLREHEDDKLPPALERLQLEGKVHMNCFFLDEPW